MTAIPTFTEAVGDIAGLLRDHVPSHLILNCAASRIDRLGRQLHGFGFVHDSEIAHCFTAAIRELTESRVLPEEQRAGPVSQAILQLETALSRVASGERAS